jgi:fimbrial isopeptide formation D2 family protein
VAIVVSVAGASGSLVYNGAYVDPTNAITEDNEDADDPALACAAVGEGAAGAAEPDNYDCTSHTVTPLPDLTITKTASPSETTVVDTGDTITYTLTVTNSASATATATSVPIRDYIGDGLTFSSVTAGTGVTCTDTTGPEIDCTATSIAPGQSRTVTIVVTVSATSGTVLNGARVDRLNAITETNEDADDPTLDCSAVGEGTDAGSATEADNYDCASHSLEEATPTPTPTPTPGQLLDCPWSGKWAMSVWDGPSGTATGTALATCTGATINAAYALDRVTQTWSRYFPGAASGINNLRTVGAAPNGQGRLGRGTH